MRTLAIDVGQRRIGLALSDSNGQLATPLDVLQVNSAEAGIPNIMRVLKDEGVERIVVGLPLNMDDTFGPAAKQAIAWGRKLEMVSGLPVIYVDERLSSFEAEQQLNQRKRAGEKLTRQRKKGQLDAIAAAHFLQAFLDGRLTAISV